MNNEKNAKEISYLGSHESLVRSRLVLKITVGNYNT